MNREIKFRGSELFENPFADQEDSLFFVFGSLLIKGGLTFITARFKNHYINIEVAPATVGQYTGLKDRDGKEVYEGDIVEKENDFFVVDFIDGQFVAKSIKTSTVIFSYGIMDSRIVGNIHEKNIEEDYMEELNDKPVN